MRTPLKIEYYEALYNYYHKTKGHVPAAIVNKVDSENKTIIKYEEHHNPISKRQAIINASLNLFARIIGTITYSVLVVYVLKEVFGVSLTYSTKNILLLTLILFAYKAKFRLTNEK